MWYRLSLTEIYCIRDARRLLYKFSPTGTISFCVLDGLSIESNLKKKPPIYTHSVKTHEEFIQDCKLVLKVQFDVEDMYNEI